MKARPMPEHGTRACYLRGCRKPECAEAHRRYCKRYQVTRLGKGEQRVDAAAAAKRCRELVAQGWSGNQIALAADCSARTIHNLLNGGAKVHRDIAAKILATDVTSLRQPALSYVDSTGSIRRARALFAIGHKTLDIAAAIDMEPVALSRVLNRNPATVRAHTALALSELYDSWSRRPGAAKRNRTLADQRGWHGPEAWDDDIDDPKAKPNAELHLTEREQAKERLADILLLATAGVAPDQIAARTGLSKGYVRERLKAELPTTLLELTA